jgi:stage V sporulation protein SpoVS
MDTDLEKNIDQLKPEEVVTALKVKADPADISPDDRKRNVKKLAGAISHSLRSNGEISVRCFGPAAISKAAKALAIAQTYIGVQNLQLSFAPGFITTKIGDNELTGISFYTFAQEKKNNVDMDKVKSVLMVKADPEDMPIEEKKLRVRKLAGAITHSLEENKEVAIRCFGSATIGKAVKALTIARSFVSLHGLDLYANSIFIVAKMNENERTGICFYAYTNEL